MGPILEEYREALLTLRILRRRLLFNRLALLTAIPHYWVVTLWIYYRRIATGAIKQFVFSVVFAVFGFAAVLLTPWLHDLIAFPVLMICFGGSMALLKVPPDEHLEMLLSALDRGLQKFRLAIDDYAGQLSSQNEFVEQYRRDHETPQRESTWPSWLTVWSAPEQPDSLEYWRGMHWRHLSGYDFEHYLEEILRHYGLSARQIGKSGDQGIDLIATLPDGKLIGIQAKGYPSGIKVNNSDVLKTVGGIRFHSCHVAVLITNSTLTSPAMDAARQTDCCIVDGQTMEDFIGGQFPW